MRNPMIRPCSSCGRKNRVPAAHLADEGSCGACKAPLPPLSEPVDVDTAEFDAIVNEARVPVLVDFWAAWCGPCRVAAPQVARLAHERAGRALVLKVDTDRNPELAARYQVRGIPNFIVFRDGHLRLQRAGFADATTMQTWLDQAA